MNSNKKTSEDEIVSDVKENVKEDDDYSSDEDLLEEDLDKELRAAARSHLATAEEELELDGEGEEDDTFGY